MLEEEKMREDKKEMVNQMCAHEDKMDIYWIGKALSKSLSFFFFFAVLRLDLRAFILSHSTSPYFFVNVFF
jgi:hypothetical protein